ncbi:MAG: DUF1134 domain-containing protein [Bauldia sp.]|nr:DUF1134 domain-containing protein [Bauldia sp.]
MIKTLSAVILAFSLALPLAASPAAAQSDGGYSSDELIREGQKFFGGVTEGLASIVEQAVSQYGLPNGYILGQEGSGAIIGGLRYGEGTLHTKNAGQHDVFWQGPSLGPDIGGSGDRVMMLVYNLPDVSAMYQRFLGVAGTAHVVAGFGMTVLGRNGIYVVPIVSGVGARLGISFGYLKFTQTPTWNPF